jgi:hypothetical protein
MHHSMDMGHDHGGMDMGGHGQCDMNVGSRTGPQVVCLLAELTDGSLVDALHLVDQEPLHHLPRLAHHGPVLAYSVAHCDCALDGGL